MERCIFCSAPFLISATDIFKPPNLQNGASRPARARCGGPGSRESPRYVNESLHVDEGTLVLALYDALERARFDDRKHPDRQFLVAAQRERRGVHHLQIAADRLVEADRGVTR